MISLFTPVDNIVDIFLGNRNSLRGVPLRHFAREKAVNIVRGGNRAIGVSRGLHANARSHLASACAMREETYPHAHRFYCGYVHRKNAQTLKE
jgi:hypothetical protein